MSPKTYNEEEIEKVMAEVNTKALAERDSGYCGGCGKYQEELRIALTKISLSSRTTLLDELLRAVGENEVYKPGNENWNDNIRTEGVNAERNRLRNIIKEYKEKK